MVLVLLVAAALSAGPTTEEIEILKTFREEFIVITPGRGIYPKHFTMGRREGGDDNERPVHKVTIDYDFQIAKNEVPQNLWQAVMGDNPSKWKGPRNSVEMLSLEDAVTFCQRATEQMRSARLIEKEALIRLPSEAEWEYVARAGTTTVYSFGEQATDLDAYGWHTGNAAGNDPPVGAKKPNAWGLYDIHGYLWEWCTDSAHPNYEQAPTNGLSWEKGGDKTKCVVRGGSWKDGADRLTSSFRLAIPRETRDDAVGLRCVLISPKK